MRRVMVTPTFAAGLGVVIAAVMVYPMSRMVFSYGARCQAPGCGSGAGGGLGTSAPAQPGKQMGTNANPANQAPAQSSRPGNGKFPPGQPRVTYLTVSQWDGGFTGQITINFQSRSVPANWDLWINYPSARIVSVSGGTWHANTLHSGVVSGASPSSGAQELKVGFTVGSSDPGGPPAGCSFDGKSCRFSTSDDSSAGGTLNDVSASPLKLGHGSGAAGRGNCKAARNSARHQSGPLPCHRKPA
jgi:hypothetical protein